MNEKIVVIEDNHDILEILRYNLDRASYAVHSCSDGYTGLQRVRDEIPDLVLLDLMIPGLSGMEVCQQLKSGNTTESIPAIMVTAKGEDRDIARGIRAGADGYITKPFTLKDLLARVRGTLDRTKVNREKVPHRDDPWQDIQDKWSSLQEDLTKLNERMNHGGQ